MTAKRRARRADPAALQRQLTGFEQRYGMSSAEFLRRWHAGELDDRREFFTWFGVCHLAQKMGLLAPAAPAPSSPPEEAPR